MRFAKKSLGQNFLTSGRIRTAIIDAGEIHSEDIVLETGPGMGFLTEKMLPLAKRLVAVEKDSRLIPILEEKFSEYSRTGKLELLERDILDFDTEEMRAYGNSYKVIANIPYYITGQFIRKFLTADFKPNKMVIMVQSEVADRIIARDGKESLLSLSVKAFSTPTRVIKVSKNNFSPAPSIDSAVISLNNISSQFKNTDEEKAFFELLKKGFGQKRKMLSGTLGLKVEDFEGCKISPKSRPEELSLEKWLCLADK